MWYLSASRLNDFIDCPMKYHLKKLGIEPVDKSDTLRIGQHWHKLHELVGDEKDFDKIWSTACDYLNGAYDSVPEHLREKMELERTILLYSFAAYHQHYKEEREKYEIVATEVDFEIPLVKPDTGVTCRNVRLRGRIDNMCVDKRTGCVFVQEDKTTSSDISPESSYWDNLELDVQSTLYLYASRLIQKDPPVVGILYDVWRKPSIRPKKLSQADTKNFIETGEYCGSNFNIDVTDGVSVNGERAEITPAAKEGVYAIRETNSMFGARLYTDILSRPEYYFQRREIARTEWDLSALVRQIYCIFQAIKTMEKTDGWYCASRRCEEFSRCEYAEICYNHIDVTADLPRTYYNRKENKND